MGRNTHNHFGCIVFVLYMTMNLIDWFLPGFLTSQFKTPKSYFQKKKTWQLWNAALCKTINSKYRNYRMYRPPSCFLLYHSHLSTLIQCQIKMKDDPCQTFLLHRHKTSNASLGVNWIWLWSSLRLCRNHQSSVSDGKLLYCTLTPKKKGKVLQHA